MGRRVVVLAGGISSERDVSLSSGKMIYQALRKNGNRVILLDVYLGLTEDVTEDIFEDGRDWSAQIGEVSENNPDISMIKALRPDGDKNFFGPNVLTLCRMADVVFMALHGENGENGKIQACFDLMGITYTGTDYVSSAICMNKSITKELFGWNGIPSPKGLSLKKGEKPDWEKIDQIGFPCIVKACCGGSSVGVCIVEEKDRFDSACEEVYQYDDEIVVEEYIKGREFSVGVLEGRALPVIEIAPLQGFYDYKNKYQAGATVETCPASLNAEKAEELKTCAEKVYRILRLKNYARMDFMMNEKEEIFCLEANTLPGMTPTSLLPQEAAAEGIDFGQLCEMIMDSCVK